MDTQEEYHKAVKHFEVLGAWLAGFIAGALFGVLIWAPLQGVM